MGVKSAEPHDNHPHRNLTPVKGEGVCGAAFRVFLLHCNVAAILLSGRCAPAEF